MLSRDPHRLLVPFVQRVWATWPDSAPRTVTGRELLLPAPEMHLAFRLGGDAFHFFHRPEDFKGETLGHAVVGGVRTRSYVKALSPAARSVGALLKPGTGELLFGVPNGQLADCHVPLATLWGRTATEAAFERLHGADSIDDGLSILEDILLAHLPPRPVLHPVVAYGLRELPRCDRVGDVVARTGYSHKRIVELFDRQVGLSPKTYSRMRRFQRAIRILERNPGAAWSEVALRAGYSDQPHFSRDFRNITGMTARAYRTNVITRPGHIAL